MINETLYSKAQELASDNYDVVIETDVLSNGKQVFLGICPELRGCMTQVDDMKDMFAMLKDARTAYIYSLLLDGLPVPTTQSNVLRVTVPFEVMKK